MTGWSATSLVGTWRLASVVTTTEQGSVRFLGPNRLELGVVTMADGRPAPNATTRMWERQVESA